MRGVTHALAIAIAAQSLAGVALVYVVYFRGRTAIEPLVRPVNFDIENTIPAIYQTLQLDLCAVSLAVIAQAGRPIADIARELRYWWLLAGICTYLAFDERASIHEPADLPMRRLLGVGGVFYCASGPGSSRRPRCCASSRSCSCAWCWRCCRARWGCPSSRARFTSS